MNTLIGKTLELSNQVADLKTPPDWIEIPFGNHQHKEGTQVVDKESAQAMLANFTEAAKSKRFAGLPIYVGHPDHPDFSARYPDSASKGWIKELDVTPSALRLRTVWNATGAQLVADEAYKYFSPTWGVMPVPGHRGAYRPMRLKSIGLTNEPNIGVMPLTNEKENPMQILPPWLVKLLGLAEDAGEETVKEKLTEIMKKLGDSQSGDAGRRRRESGRAIAIPPGASSTVRSVLALVNSRMEDRGEDYDTAFSRIREDHAELFANMKQPAKAY
jgi:hypothetical protein